MVMREEAYPQVVSFAVILSGYDPILARFEVKTVIDGIDWSKIKIVLSKGVLSEFESE